ncbi:hypothetical protein AMAG_19647 [Allomyces macrogynus ATCC 38327]|uniref:Uncharacterized protein n=1 Tax=Allomyces macrogynus (strain ATCC 38327) TaxID=578462 RepID=A0A0L0SX47_ALLM3|nr:hypothetical protein AMAG_19647 [Allomyces macrogynus ATCC 38327]|eukprot:KNE67051.1 hypothetical protein AMAG_19647 [Allomyces macrogynus ATCC 38327]
MESKAQRTVQDLQQLSQRIRSGRAAEELQAAIKAFVAMDAKLGDIAKKSSMAAHLSARTARHMATGIATIDRMDGAAARAEPGPATT